jgi:hypothetical protein
MQPAMIGESRGEIVFDDAIAAENKKNPGNAGISSCLWENLLVFVKTIPAATVSAVIAAAATFVVAAATFVVTAAATEAALFETTATATGLILRAGFVDDQFTALYIGFIEAGNSLERFLIIFHFHKTETLAATRFPVHDDFSRRNLAKLGEKVEQILVPEVEIHVANVDVHDKKFTNKTVKRLAT